MIRFLLISLFFYLLVACKPYQLENAIPVKNTKEFVENNYFSNPELDYVYKAHIEVYGNDVSGIFVVKRINETTHRLVLTTDFGNKLLDFEISESDFKVNFIMDNLNKKIIINTLKNDFKTLLQVNNKIFNTYSTTESQVFLSDNKTYYYIDNATSILHKIIKTNKRKEKVIFTFSTKKTTFAENISIAHKNIKLKIELNQIIN